MTYIENPKTKGSGIVCAIPQRGECPMRCADCFFQSGRSYLEPLSEHLPNLPSYDIMRGRVVRVNDGNDSNHDRAEVLLATDQYRERFFNTAIPRLDFPGPVVLTVNPGSMTDTRWHRVEPVPANLMFVRFRTNAWNTETMDQVVGHYTERSVPVVLTFMAYHDQDAIPSAYRCWYAWKTRTLNPYWAITVAGWERIVARFRGNALVYTCGKNANTHACARCGNCLREYYATKERIRP